MTSGELIRLLLPVIWAIVSTAIGLILYRTSSAFFEDTQQTQGSKRKIRIVGSICIAALAYIGLWRATPTSLQVGVPLDSQLVRQVDIHAAGESIQEAAAAVTRLEGCATIAPPVQCRREIDLVSDRVAQAQRKLDALSRP
jgi:hypothetical protein